MHGLYPLIGRRNFLASTVAGTIGTMLSGTSATAAMSASGFGGSAIGTAASAQMPSGDRSIRPFRYHATDEELADLKRRINATKWPERENDPTQGVNLTTIQKLAGYSAKASCR